MLNGNNNIILYLTLVLQFKLTVDANKWPCILYISLN